MQSAPTGVHNIHMPMGGVGFDVKISSRAFEGTHLRVNLRVDAVTVKRGALHANDVCLQAAHD